MTYRIMFVDDEPANLRLLERIFRRDYQVVTASSGAEALELLQQYDVALLITDQRMPGMTGIELLERAATMRPHVIRMLLTGYTDVDALVKAINSANVYQYVTKPWNNDELRRLIKRALEYYETNRALHEYALANGRLAARLQEMTAGFVRAIADALEAKDEYMFGHSRRVSGYAVAIGSRLGLNENELKELSLAAFLHDIGKISTPDSIILSPDRLTDDERRVMQHHPERGARILASIPELQGVADIIRHHHESFDGSGYPQALHGEQIPLAARIISVADAYDAITSPRTFRKTRSHEEAIAVLEENSDGQFDPAVVRAFQEVEAIGLIRRSIAAGIFGGRLSVISQSLDASEMEDGELWRIIESEPALAAAVMHMANTEFVAEPTTNLRDAMDRLGETRLRLLISRHSLQDEHSASAEELWEHSVRCASAARLLAERTGTLSPDEAFTVGLLHDVGETLLRYLFPAEMESLRGLERAERIEREIAEFGVDHAQVGEWVLEGCRLSRNIAIAVQTHHDMMRINEPVALLLHLADNIAQAGDPYKTAAFDAVGNNLAMLGLNRTDLADIHARTDIAYEQHLVA